MNAGELDSQAGTGLPQDEVYTVCILTEPRLCDRGFHFISSAAISFDAHSNTSPKMTANAVVRHPYRFVDRGIESDCSALVVKMRSLVI